jgi:hypothetical protein
MGRTLDALLADDPPLASLFDWRMETLSALLRRIKVACACELLLDRGDVGCAASAAGQCDWSIPDGVVTRLEDPDQLSATLSPGAQRHELRIPESWFFDARGSGLVSTLSEAVRLGLTTVEIDNYGLLPESALVLIKQAIRFARRTDDE